MTESKIGATDRLRKEGRWEEASLWRDEKRKQLRAEGLSKAEANDDSWQAMIEAFPPLPVEELPTHETYETVELLDIDDYEDRPDMSRDILWVYENLVREGVNPEDAPSLGAWALLKWARENRNRFFEQVLPKAKIIEEQVEEVEARLEDEAQIQEIHKMIDKAKLEWQQEAVANMDKAVKESVKARLAVWGKQFQLDLPKDAREGLSLRMLRIVNDAVGAMAEHPGVLRQDEVMPVR
jgi:hypothetical protein